MTKKFLAEVKATGEDSEANDPVDTGSTKRPLDKSQGDKSADKLSGEVEHKHDGTGKAEANLRGVKGSSATREKMQKVKEAFDSLFEDEGADLTEDFKLRLRTIFEAAVSETVAEIEESLEKKYSTVLETYQDDLKSQLNEYAAYVAREWAKENRIAIESGIRADIAESVISGLKTLMAEHNIAIEDDQVDVVEQMADEIDALTEALREKENQLLEMRMEDEKSLRNKIVQEISEGLADTQVDRLTTLAENIAYSDLAEFRSKLSILKENFFGEKAPKAITEDLDNGAVVDDVNVIDPFIASIAKKLSTTVR